MQQAQFAFGFFFIGPYLSSLPVCIVLQIGSRDLVKSIFCLSINSGSCVWSGSISSLSWFEGYLIDWLFFFSTFYKCYSMTSKLFSSLSSSVAIEFLAISECLEILSSNSSSIEPAECNGSFCSSYSTGIGYYDESLLLLRSIYLWLICPEFYADLADKNPCGTFKRSSSSFSEIFDS